MVWQTLFSEAG